MLPPLAALRAFEAAARHLSFLKAADELAVTPTAISHQIRLLEDMLGLPVFVRHVRRITLTPSGSILYPVLREGFDAFAGAIEQIDARRSRPSVTLSTMTLFAARRLVPALGSFTEAHPGIDLHLHASDMPVDLAAGRVDIAVRYGAGSVHGLVAEPLLSDQFGVLCSPSLGIGMPDDLAKVPLLHAEWKSRMEAPDWRRWAALAGVEGLPLTSGARFTDDAHAVQAAIAGHGALISSLVLAAPDIAAALLSHPFGPVIQGETYTILATPAALARTEVAAVRDWLRTLAIP